MLQLLTRPGHLEHHGAITKMDMGTLVSVILRAPAQEMGEPSPEG